MVQGLLVWLGCGALVVIIALAFWWRVMLKKKHADNIKFEADIFDFHVDYYGARSGWHGTFWDGEILKNALLNLKENEIKKRDVVCVFSSEMKDGFWQATPMRLSQLGAGKVVATGKKTNGLWKCIYPNEYGIALIGWIRTSKELQANKKYAVVQKEKNYFELL